MEKKYHVVGLMSGTSLDGVDIAYCEFSNNGKWSYELIAGQTIPYEPYWLQKLPGLMNSTSEEISRADCEFGNFLGEQVKKFCARNKFAPDYIASHGHTIFHQPERKFTRQLGHGAWIAAASGISVISDFRSLDVALGGQGAPLVPAGDRHLFGDMDYCLNLGGIANISFEKENERIAFDICGCNMLLNRIAGEAGVSYDEGGRLAATGNISESLLASLEAIPYFSKPFPKSLGREEIEHFFFPLTDNRAIPMQDRLATVAIHIARRIGAVTGEGGVKKMLVTGGGAFNTFLLKQIREWSGTEVIIPPSEIIEFKEAIIFAFLGVLRLRNEINCLRSVTGASRDNCGGMIFGQ